MAVSINTKRAERRLRNLEREIRQKSDATVNELGRLGKDKAKSIVPYYSGNTFKSIRRRTTRGSQGAEARIFIEPYILDDGHVRNIANFSLVRWMHTSPRAVGHIKSGDRLFMYTTRNYLNEIKTGVAQGKFKNINIR